MSKTPKSCDECKYIQRCDSCYGEYDCQHKARIIIKKKQK